MTGMRDAGRGGWKVSDLEATTFAQDLLEWQQTTGSSWGDIVVISGRKHTSQGWLRDIANGCGPARSGTIGEFRALMEAYPDGVPAGATCNSNNGKAAHSSRPISAENMALFSRELTEYVYSNSISFSDLARLCGYNRRCGTWLQGLANGRTRAKADTVLRIRRTMNANPNAEGLEIVKEGRPKVAPAKALQSNGPFIPAHIVTQIEIAANREAAAARRAAWIEEQRQAELAKYGRTTIEHDVMDMVA